MVVWFYYQNVYKTQPDYVHRVVIPPYIAAAQKFYDTNKELLVELALLQGTIEEGTEYSYVFHMPDSKSNSEFTPENILDILLKLELCTNEQYCVSIARYGTDIRIDSSTYHDVFLYHGEMNYVGMDGETREIQLENGWTIQALYMHPPTVLWF